MLNIQRENAETRRRYAEAIEKFASGGADSRTKLAGIGSAIVMEFHLKHRTCPAAFSRSPEKKPLLSWRVELLPYLGASQPYELFHHDEPWDSPHNAKLIPYIPSIYKSPAGQSHGGRTNYLAIRGRNCVLDEEPTSMANVRDGMVHTIMIVEASDDLAVPWTKSEDYKYDAENPTKGLIGLHEDGFLAVFADASVKLIRPGNNDDETFAAAFNANDGKHLQLEETRPARK